MSLSDIKNGNVNAQARSIKDGSNSLNPQDYMIVNTNFKGGTFFLL